MKLLRLGDIIAEITRSSFKKLAVVYPYRVQGPTEARAQSKIFRTRMGHTQQATSSLLNARRPKTCSFSIQPACGPRKRYTVYLQISNQNNLAFKAIVI